MLLWSIQYYSIGLIYTFKVYKKSLDSKECYY